MSLDVRMIHTITVYNVQTSTSVDIYGNPDETLDSGRETRAWVWPDTGNSARAGTFEEDLDRQTSVSHYRVLAPLDCGVTKSSVVEFEGRRYEVMGSPIVPSNRNGAHHVEFALRLEEQ